MKKVSAPISLAGSQLGETRHVCAFFNSDDEEYRVLLPFIKEGFKCGDKAVHVVNPDQHSDHLQRLTTAGIDPTAAQQSGQFELRTNTETYLREGRFDQDRMLESFEQLASGNANGAFPLSRIVCRMDWAAEGGSHIDDLVEFESRVNDVWRRHDDAVICTYHLTKFGGDTVIDIMRTHPMIIIGGILQQNPFFVPPEGEDALRTALAQVARSEERWRSVFENSAIGVALTDLDGRFIATNPVFRKMLGYNEEELQSLSFLDLTQEEYLGPNRTLVGQLLEGTCQQFQIEKQYHRKDGKSVWARNNVSIVPGTERVPRFLMALSEDITERKQAEEALRASELHLRQMTETIPEMLWSATPEGVIDYCNARFLEYTGRSAEEVMGNGWQKTIHPDDAARVAPVWMSCVKTGALYRVEVRHLHAADHAYRWCVTSALPLFDQHGRIRKWYGTVVDMHDWKQAQEELRNTQAELAHLRRVMTMGALTASIAHEVNQPLSGIVTNASTCLRMLATDPPNVDGARETARRTIRDGNRASEVITRLRALFSKKEFVPESMDLNEAAREVIALSFNELQRNQVILRPALADDLPPVTGDRVQLQQVILNLLRNGSDAMSTVDDRPRELLIKTERDEGDGVRLTVQDAGVGFEPQAAARLFEAFYTTKNHGMGIGLSVSRSIIEAHHGRLWATTNDGPGATFSFSIPRSPVALVEGNSDRDIDSPEMTDAA